MKEHRSSTSNGRETPTLVLLPATVAFETNRERCLWRTSYCSIVSILTNEPINSLLVTAPLVVGDAVDGSGQSEGSSGLKVLYESGNIASFESERNAVGRGLTGKGSGSSSRSEWVVASGFSSAWAEGIGVGAESGSSSNGTGGWEGCGVRVEAGSSERGNSSVERVDVCHEAGSAN